MRSCCTKLGKECIRTELSIDNTQPLFVGQRSLTKKTLSDGILQIKWIH